ncbi:hypothetical protein BGZ47_003786 [Haplosporangium gracile]|nr:hypothetical protein BGZ47_003786 [Haplosporangium gracile]
MRFAAAASILALASTVLAANPWKNMGGDFAIIGPSFNASVKVGDTIPFEYAFYTLKMVGNNTNTTAPTLNTGSVTLTSLSWVGATGNKTVEIAWDNGRNTGYAAVCQPADTCIGNYYPKRAELTIPADSYPSNYTLVIGYTLKLVQETKLTYKFPINVVAASANVTSPVATIADAPIVKATLPTYAPPASSGLVNKASKAVVGVTMVLASAMLLL